MHVGARLERPDFVRVVSQFLSGRTIFWSSLMGMIESEFLTSHFENLVQLVVSAAAIPVPTFAVLGADRLVASLKWPSLNIVPAPPGLEPPPGNVLARAAVTIGHASVAE